MSLKSLRIARKFKFLLSLITILLAVSIVSASVFGQIRDAFPDLDKLDVARQIQTLTNEVLTNYGFHVVDANHKDKKIVRAEDNFKVSSIHYFEVVHRSTGVEVKFEGLANYELSKSSRDWGVEIKLNLLGNSLPIGISVNQKYVFNKLKTHMTEKFDAWLYIDGIILAGQDLHKNMTITAVGDAADVTDIFVSLNSLPIESRSTFYTVGSTFVGDNETVFSQKVSLERIDRETISVNVEEKSGSRNINFADKSHDIFEIRMDDVSDDLSINLTDSTYTIYSWIYDPNLDDFEIIEKEWNLFSTESSINSVSDVENLRYFSRTYRDDHGNTLKLESFQKGLLEQEGLIFKFGSINRVYINDRLLNSDYILATIDNHDFSFSEFWDTVELGLNNAIQTGRKIGSEIAAKINSFGNRISEPLEILFRTLQTYSILSVLPGDPVDSFFQTFAEGAIKGIKVGLEERTETHAVIDAYYNQKATAIPEVGFQCSVGDISSCMTIIADALIIEFGLNAFGDITELKKTLAKGLNDMIFVAGSAVAYGIVETLPEGAKDNIANQTIDFFTFLGYLDDISLEIVGNAVTTLAESLRDAETKFKALLESLSCAQGTFDKYHIPTKACTNISISSDIHITSLAVKSYDQGAIQALHEEARLEEIQKRLEEALQNTIEAIGDDSFNISFDMTHLSVANCINIMGAHNTHYCEQIGSPREGVGFYRFDVTGACTAELAVSSITNLGTLCEFKVEMIGSDGMRITFLNVPIGIGHSGPSGGIFPRGQPGTVDTITVTRISSGRTITVQVVV